MENCQELSAVLLKEHEFLFMVSSLRTVVSPISFFSLAGILTGGHLQGFTPVSIALLAYMALLSSLAFGIWSTLLKHNPVGRVAIYNFLIPVFGVALSAVFLHEAVFAWKNLLALVLVCAGIWLVTAEKTASGVE